MPSPAVRADQSSLEAALLDVHATLADLLVAADEQYAAVAVRDRDLLESVTRQQERLAARLAQAAAKRLAVLGDVSLSTALRVLPKTEAARLEPLARSIGTRVRALKERQAQTASLLDQSINLASDTIEFLQRLLVRSDAPAYGRRSPTVRPPSLLVDGRA